MSEDEPPFTLKLGTKLGVWSASGPGRFIPVETATGTLQTGRVLWR
jgi:hypothetical protein